MAGHSALVSPGGPAQSRVPTTVDTGVEVQPKFDPWSLVMK
jgi:hypothetical protein